MRARISLVSTPVGLTSHERLYLQASTRGDTDPVFADVDIQLLRSLTHDECTSLGYSDISRALFESCPEPIRGYMPWEGLYILYKEATLAFPNGSVALTDIDLMLAKAAGAELSVDEVAESVLSSDPGIVGISLNYSIARPDFRELCRALKSRSSSVKIIAGGRHATARPGDAMDCGADFVFLGEADGGFRVALQALLKGGGVPDLPWFVASPSHGARARLAKAHELAVPDYGPLRGENLQDIVPVLYASVARGCGNRCCFCSHAAFYQGRCTHYPADAAVATIQNVGREFGFAAERLFVLQHVSFGIDLDWTRRLLARLRDTPPPGPWVTDMRPDSVLLLGKEGLDMMAESGCIGVFLGVESFNDEALRKCGKAYDSQDIWKALKVLKNSPLFVATYWVVGLPGETPATCLRDVVLRCLDLLDASEIDLAQPHLLTVLPGTRLALRPKEYGVISVLTDSPSFLAHSASVQVDLRGFDQYRLFGLYVFFLAELRARIPRQIDTIRKKVAANLGTSRRVSLCG